MERCRVELVHHWPEKGVPWLRKKQSGRRSPARAPDSGDTIPNRENEHGVPGTLALVEYVTNPFIVAGMPLGIYWIRRSKRQILLSDIADDKPRERPEADEIDVGWYMYTRIAEEAMQ